MVGHKFCMGDPERSGVCVLSFNPILLTPGWFHTIVLLSYCFFCHLLEIELKPDFHLIHDTQIFFFSVY